MYQFIVAQNVPEKSSKFSKTHANLLGEQPIVAAPALYRNSCFLLAILALFVENEKLNMHWQWVWCFHWLFLGVNILLL